MEDIFKPLPKEERIRRAKERRNALVKQASQRQLTIYFDLTIRKVMGVLEAVTYCHDSLLSQLAEQYDIDSPDDFLKWSNYIDHLLDLEYARVSLIPRYAGILEGRHGWYYELFDRRGTDAIDVYGMGSWALGLHEAGVNFYLACSKKYIDKRRWRSWLQ